MQETRNAGHWLKSSSDHEEGQAWGRAHRGLVQPVLLSALDFCEIFTGALLKREKLGMNCLSIMHRLKQRWHISVMEYSKAL